MSLIRLPATWMRGGTSKGLFFDPADLPADPAQRDALLLRALGSPDPYGTQMDGIGGATSSTSKVALVARSTRPGFDLDYRFGAVAIDEPMIDWSGNCGNLSAAVGVFALARGLIAPSGRRHRRPPHLAGQHRQNHRRPRASARWAGSRKRGFPPGRA